jgi:hypothetical protein
MENNTKSTPECQFDIHRIFSKSIRYFILGLGIIVLLITVPDSESKLSINEILIIAVLTSLLYAIMDLQLQM